MAHFAAQGMAGLGSIWPAPTAWAWCCIGSFAALQAAMQLLVPGKKFVGPVTPMGNQPVYKVRGGTW